MKAINPYLNFPGNCEEAFEFYRSAIGGEFVTKMYFKDVPAEMQMPGTPQDMIMHISLPVGESAVLMGSDRPQGMGEGSRGDNFSLSLSTGSEAEADKVFAALSAGGKVTLPLAKAFWGAYFGMLVDKYGVQWMVSCG